MGAYEVLVICALLCSSDVIAAIAMVDYGAQPKLFSIVYGEGVFNDIVSIILFGVVVKFNEGFELTVLSALGIVGNFLLLAATSLAIGLVGGIISAIIFKKARFLTHSAIIETLIINVFAFTTYMISEATENSGIITLLTCGIT